MPKPIIFWVEDNDRDVLLLRTAFEEVGLPVEFVVADNAVRAYHYLDSREPYQTSPRPPDLVIVDLNLPAISGYSVLREAKAHPLLQGVPMVVYTSSADPRELRTCLGLGAVECITKPKDLVGYGEVIARLRRHLPRDGAGPAAHLEPDGDPAKPSDSSSLNIPRPVIDRR